MTLFRKRPLTVWVIALVALAPAAAEDPKPVPALVRGRVTAVGERQQSGAVIATIEVVYVYAGPATILKGTFQDTQRGEGDYNGRAARSPFTVGEEGLWSIREVKGRLQIDSPGAWPIRYRSRKADNPRHPQAVLVAEVIEKVAAAKLDDRFAILKPLLRNETTEVAAWAMKALGRSEGAAERDYIAGQCQKPDTSLPITVQIALDEVLVERKGTVWQASKPREALLVSWVDGKRGDDEAGQILSRVYMAYQGYALSAKAATELHIAAATNAGYSRASRQRAIGYLGSTARLRGEDEAAFDWLLEFARRGIEIELRRGAAETLRDYFALTPKREKRVEELLRTETDNAVRTALEQALKKAKEREKKK
jgi:hypothetical protein